MFVTEAALPLSTFAERTELVKLVRYLRIQARKTFEPCGRKLSVPSQLMRFASGSHLWAVVNRMVRNRRRGRCATLSAAGSVSGSSGARY